MASTHLAHLGASTVDRLRGISDGWYDSKHVANWLLNEDSLKRAKTKLLEMDVLIIDNVSMLSRRTFEKIDQLLRIINKG